MSGEQPVPQSPDSRAALAAVKAQLDNLTNDVRGLKSENVRLVASSAKVTTTLEGLIARVDALLARDQVDIQKLFELDGIKGGRIAAIEKDYTPEAAFNEHVKENAREHDTVRNAINCLDRKVTKLFAWGGAAFLALNAIIVYSIRILSK